MILFLFVLIHILIGLGLIYGYGKLPKGVTVFAFVFFTMSFLYWGVILTKSLMN